MHRPCLLRLALAFATATLAPAVEAQTRDAAAAASLFSQEIRPGATLDGFLGRVENIFIELNAEGETLNAEDMEVHATMLGGFIGASAAAKVMSMDLDRDGFVTEDEVRRFVRYQSRTRPQNRRHDRADIMKRELQRALKFDKDGDGRVTWAEAFEPPKLGVSQNAAMNSPIRRLRLAFTFDSDGDGDVSLSEFRAVAEAMFRSTDGNGDGVLSAEEITGRKKQESVAAQRAADAPCAMPAADPEAEVVLIGLYSPEALSTAAIGSQDRMVTTAGLVIEPGDTPLYIVIASYAGIIWRVSGATERVEHLVLGSLVSAEHEGVKVPLVGATGLPADRVTPLGRTNCMRFFNEAPSSAAAAAAGKVRDAAGKEPTRIVAINTASEVSVPSGDILKLRRTPGDPNTPAEENYPRKDVTRSHPGGVIDIDPQAVVSSLPTMPYEVLPAEAGLRQLLSDGALTQNESSEYLIHRKIRYPAGLNGAVVFLLLSGVPEPDGDSAGARVFSEETGSELHPRP